MRRQATPPPSPTPSPTPSPSPSPSPNQVSHAALEAGLRWGGAASGAPPYSDTAPPYSAAEARWTDNRTLTLTVLAPLAPDANASAPPPPAACGGGLSVTVLPA